MNQAKAFVDLAIKQYKIVGFSKTHCPYCEKARKAIESLSPKKEAYEWIEIDGRADCSEIQDYLKELTGARSVPRVFINGKFFGGGDDTYAAKQNGILEQKLKEAGAI